MARELKDVEVQFISYVDKAANKKKFFLLKADDLKEPNFEKKVKILTKKDDPKKLVYGIVYVPNEVDSQGDFMTEEEIEKACHLFMKNFQKIDEQHDFTEGAGTLVECGCQLADIEIGDVSLIKGTWTIVTEATDEIWEKIEKGEYTGYSLAGVAQKIVNKKEKKFEDLILKYKNRTIELILKDFDSTLEDLKNTDIYLPMDIWYRATLDAFWNSETPDDFKKAAKKINSQYLKYINAMTFEKVIKEEKKIEGEDAMENKQEVQAMIDKSLEPFVKSLGLEEGQTVVGEIEKAIGEIPSKPLVMKDAEGKDVNLVEVIKSLVEGVESLKSNATIKKAETQAKIDELKKEIDELIKGITENGELPEETEEEIIEKTEGEKKANLAL